MEWRDRTGAVVIGDDGQDRLLSFLYQTGFGRCIVKIMIHPWVSKLVGWLMDRRISAIAIPGFLKNSHIDMSEYEQRKFGSFNDFFTRKILESKRPVDMDASHFIAPCDSKLCVYSITKEAKFCIKETWYTLEELVKDKEVAASFEGGQLLLFRLTVGDYHRYSYVESGNKSRNYHIPGFFHTVNPVANDHYPIYKENTREFSLIDTEHFGQVLQMEVGATMVGRIVNYEDACTCVRGQEKGKFEFGGSTIIVCVQKNKVVIDSDISMNTKNGIETVVKLGEKIGELYV